MSISKRGNSWRARYYGPDGRRRSKSFKRKSDAERWLTQQRNEIIKGDWIDPARSRLTFGEFAPSFLATRTNVKPKTRHQQESLLKLHVMPTWESVALGKITYEGLAAWVSRLTDDGVGWSSIRQAARFMSAALEYAVKTGRLRSNPARGLALPRPRKRDHVFLTHEQLARLAGSAGSSRVLVLVLGYTGLRWGEATALRVCDVDLSRRRIDVRRAYSDVGGTLVLGTPKSHHNRVVPLPRFLAAELADHVQDSESDALVFTTRSGAALRSSNWRRSVFLPARNQAKVSARFRVHDLRHTAAALMVQAGYPPKMLQEILGHASITTTLDLYGHLYPGDMDKYADRLDDAA
ncbi:MAG: site-specific integrase, partial [Acidimicrobiaceae bacterium]|nr:site-specific integrase [Acidimicrobiaceae bacterium]